MRNVSHLVLWLPLSLLSFVCKKSVGVRGSAWILRGGDHPHISLFRPPLLVFVVFVVWGCSHVPDGLFRTHAQCSREMQGRERKREREEGVRLQRNRFPQNGSLLGARGYDDVPVKCTPGAGMFVSPLFSCLDHPYPVCVPLLEFLFSSLLIGILMASSSSHLLPD